MAQPSGRYIQIDEVPIGRRFAFPDRPQVVYQMYYKPRHINQESRMEVQNLATTEIEHYSVYHQVIPLG